MRVIGIDPGLRRTGWGVIQIDGNQLKHVGNGVCNSTASKELSVRLLEIYLQLREVITRYKPTCAAVENTFVSKDAAGTLKLGQARGIALLAPAEAGRWSCRKSSSRTYGKNAITWCNLTWF